MIQNQMSLSLISLVQQLLDKSFLWVGEDRFRLDYCRLLFLFFFCSQTHWQIVDAQKTVALFPHNLSRVIMHPSCPFPDTFLQ